MRMLLISIKNMFAHRLNISLGPNFWDPSDMITDAENGAQDFFTEVEPKLLFLNPMTVVPLAIMACPFYFTKKWNVIKNDFMDLVKRF
jgi:hypothetical protein